MGRSIIILFIGDVQCPYVDNFWYLITFSNIYSFKYIAPISDITGRYFCDGYYGSTTSVNMLVFCYIYHISSYFIIFFKACKYISGMLWSRYTNFGSIYEIFKNEKDFIASICNDNGWSFLKINGSN